MIQRQFSRRIVFHGEGSVQPLGDRGFLFVGEMIEHVPPLMDFTALDRCRLAGILPDGRAKSVSSSADNPWRALRGLGFASPCFCREA
jgi:hypothetical protein